MKGIASLLGGTLFLSSLSSAEELAPLRDTGIAQLVANGALLANSEQKAPFGSVVRIFVFPEVVGECWGQIKSCPDWRIVFALSNGDLYVEAKAFELPRAKGWEFVRWLSVADPESGSFLVKTALPDANIDPEERGAWRPTFFKVVVDLEKASFEVVPSDV